MAATASLLPDCYELSWRASGHGCQGIGAVSTACVPGAYSSSQSMPQLMPAGLLVEASHHRLGAHVQTTADLIQDLYGTLLVPTA